VAVNRRSSVVNRQSLRPLPLAALALVLLAGALVIGAAMRAPAPWGLPFGVEGDERFSSGFYNAEQSAGQSFRWSGPGARLVLHGADAAPIALTLRLNGDQLARAGDPALRIAPDAPTGVPTTTFAVASGWRVYRALLPPLATGSPGISLLSATARPGADDGRDLGVALSAIGVRPLPAGGALAPHPRALSLAWGVGLLALALLLAGKRWPRLGRSAAATAAVGAALACAALAAWAYRSPASLALALPPAPWMLGLATLGLAALGFAPAAQRRAAQVSERLRLWGGVALLLAGQALLNAQTLVWLGIALALGGLAALATMMATGHRPQATGDRPNEDVARRGGFGLQASSLALLAIFLLALTLRLWDLGGLPFGLWRDEARHGMVALRILEDPDYRPVYVAGGGVNMPALIFYPFALAIKLFGVHPWSMRPATALAGALTVLPLYALARRLFGVRVGLLAALLLAVSAWHINVSRFSFPTVFDPLFGLAGLWLLAAALQEGEGRRGNGEGLRPLAMLLGSGAFLGLAIQTYHTGRVVPVVAGVLAAGLIFDQWRSAPAGTFRPAAVALRLLAVAAGFTIVAGPMLIYALTQQASFNDRVGGVFLLSPEALKGQAPLAALDETVRRHLLMFNVRGDENGRHAPPGVAALDYLSGLGLLVGGALALASLAARRDWRGLFLLAAAALSLLPSALAVDAPHGMRAFGALSFACILAAQGLDWLYQRARAQGRKSASHTRYLLPFALCLLPIALNVYTYFGWMRTSTDVWMSFYPVHTQMGAYVHDLHASGEDAGRQIFVPEGVVANPVFVYLTDGITVQTYSGDVLSEPLRPGALFLLSGYVYERDRVTLAPYIGASPTPAVSGAPFPGRATPSFVGYPATGVARGQRTEPAP
jgi:4-amino-4-deoxy-L-arabinose transferase-like glycosyltransferase